MFNKMVHIAFLYTTIIKNKHSRETESLYDQGI